LNNKLTAKPTVKSIFESKTPEKRQAIHKKVYNYGTFKKFDIFNAFDRRSSYKESELAELQY
jgi:hypothetical protein